MKIKVSRNPFKTKLSQEDIEQCFSVDINTEAYPLEVSINHCEETEDYSNKIDSAFSFMLKFKAFYTKDPKSVKKGLSGFSVPESGYDIKHEKGYSCHFKSVENNHFNAYYKNAGEVKASSKDVRANWSTSSKKFGQKDIDDYLMKTYKRDDWDSFYQIPDYKNWNKRLKQAFVRKFKASFGDINQENLDTAYSSKPKEMETQIAILKDLDAVTDTKEKNAFQAFLKENKL